LVARCLHHQSGRRGPFVSIDYSVHHPSDPGTELFGPCRDAACTNRSKWDTASNGTLFLKNIDALDQFLQSKLAQQAASDMTASPEVRLVTSTRRNLAMLVQEGRFLSSLYYAISTVQIETVPLRAVPDDVDQLFALLVQQAARRFGMASPTIPDNVRIQLAVYDWPGNFRELRRLAERTVLGVGEAFAAGSSSHSTSGSLVAAVEAFERALICCEMRKQSGSVVAASEALSIPKTTLYDKLHKYKVTPKEYKMGNSETPKCAPSACE
jgi:two-component system C4-dicarboxylate transport response regulator DctD